MFGGAGAWTEIDDDGEAIRRAGKPPGWFEIADAIALAHRHELDQPSSRVAIHHWFPHGSSTA